MKALLKRYKNYFVERKKARRSKKFWYYLRKKGKKKFFRFKDNYFRFEKIYFRFNKVPFLSNEVIKNFLVFNIENFKMENIRIFRHFNMAFFFRNFYKSSLFIENYFKCFDYTRVKFLKGLKSANSLDFFENCDSLYDFSKFFNLSFLDKSLKRKKEIVIDSLNRVLFFNSFLGSGKLENFFFFFFSNLKIKEKNYLNFFLFNLNNFSKNRFLLKSGFFSLDKFKRNFNFGFYNNFKWNLNFYFYKNFYNRRNLKSSK